MADTGITWGGQASDSGASTGSDGITWGASNQASPQTDFSPSGFTSYYGGAINNAADQLNVPASAIAGQWGLETGWGKSVIPGTNNLGNIKSTANSGQGVNATDNVTGSTDSYQQFDNPMDFSNAYVSMIQNNYPKAVGAQNANSFATAMKQGGYAQDPKYVSKLSTAANMANTALSALSGSSSANAAEPTAAPSNDFNSWLSKQGTAPTAQPSTNTNSAAPSFDDWMKQAQQPANSGSTLGNIWNSIKTVPGEVVDGTKAAFQHPLDYNKGLLASIWNPIANLGASVVNTDPLTADPMNGIGGDYDNATKAAVTKAAQNANITAGANANPTAFNAGKTVGQLGVAAAGGALAPEIPALEGAGLVARASRLGALVGNNAVQGAAQGAASSAINGDSLADVGKNALVGGVAGGVVGPVAHGIASMAKPVVAKVAGAKAGMAATDQAAAAEGNATGAAFSNSDLQMAGKIGDAINNSGQSSTQVAADLAGNANSTVPGYQRTAAEATDNPTIQAIQQGLDKSGDNSALANRAQSNANANTDFLRQGATSDTDLQGMKDAFAQQQDTLSARGNSEMGPVTQGQDSTVFDTPAMQKTLGRANVMAQNDGSDAIQQAFETPNNNLVNQWSGIAGSPQKTANLELLRQTTTSPQYQAILDGAQHLPVDANLQDLVTRPAMQRAQRAVETYKLNAGDNTPFVQNVPVPGQAGELYAQSVSPQDLNLAKMHLDDYIQRMSNPTDEASADKWQRNAFIGIRNQLNNTLENNVPGFAGVNRQYAQLSDQMAESQFLTSPNMVNALGNLNVRELDATVKSIQAGKANNNDFDPAKSVSNAKLAQLMQMRDDAVNAMGRNNATGIQGDSYNYVRQAAQNDPVAAQQLQQHLAGNSPAYKQFYDSQAPGEQTIAHQENYNNLVNKFDTRTDGNVSWHDVKNLNMQGNDFSAQNQQRLASVRGNLQRYASRTEGVAGSDTASNLAKRQGFEDLVTAHRGSGTGNWLMSEGGARAVRTGLGSVATGLGFAHGGPVGAIATDYLMDKLGTGLSNRAGRMLGGDTEADIAAKTAANRASTEQLLLNPARLSDALNAVDTANKAKESIATNLMGTMQNVRKVGGLLGAVSAGNATTGKGKKQ